MSRKWMFGVIVGAAVLAILAIGVAQSRADKDAPDFTGAWRLDAAKSEMPGRPGGFGGMGRGGFRRGGGEMRHGGGEPGGGPEGDRPRRGPALPPFFRIAQQSDQVDFSDSTGALFQEIRIGSKTPNQGGANPSEEVSRLTGSWANGTLEVEREGRRGGLMLQKYKLEDHGHTLEIRIERKGSGQRSDGSGRGFGARGPIKLVYRRAA